MEASLKLTGKYFRIVPDNERPCGVLRGVDASGSSLQWPVIIAGPFQYHFGTQISVGI
jgi:hypothetical protein